MPKFSEELFQTQRASEVEDQSPFPDRLFQKASKNMARCELPTPTPASALATAFTTAGGKQLQLHREFQAFQTWRLQQDDGHVEFKPRVRNHRSAAIFDVTLDTVSARDADDAVESVQLGNFCGLPILDGVAVQKPMLSLRNTQLEFI